MVKLGIQVKCSLDNVTNLRPADPEDFGWCFTLKCPQCMEEHNKDVFISKSETCDIQGSRGTANFVMSCSFCKKHSSVDILENNAVYHLSDSEKFKTLMVADFRGIEPVAFKADGEWKCSSESSSKLFDIPDGAEMAKEGWYEYDEDAGCEVSVTEFETKIVKLK
ncbi:uncharacterized protein LOC134843572 [Symsagittifera roscoffensis]|uniref:uncharacterized protein LOC134843572 n=1 Tax=Symsagittifera roscoffensis TaxID=84072 RepID=UPI00307B67FF